MVNADTYGWRYLLVEDVSDNFEELMAVRLTEGRMPENEREILLPQNVNWILSTDTGVEYHVGDVVAFDLGRRVRDGVELGEDEWIRQDIAAKKEEVVDAVERTYTVVGFYAGFSSEVDGDLPGYTALTRGGGTGSCRVFFTMKHPGQFNFYQMTAKPLSVIPHRSLLRYYGVTSSGLTNMFLGLTVFLVLLIAFGSVSLIYNSFSISVGERTRQFGLLRSVGATKKQLKSCVRYEALLLSAVGIPAGLVVGCTGIGITLWALRDYFAAIEMVSTETRMELVLSPAPLALSAAVCLATVLVSAGVPAQRAVRLTAIEAIRQSGDIKMKPREVQVSPLTRKWFGFEGMMAAKSFKRDRKRYQATVFSLFLSVTLFISASSLCAYVTGSVDVMTGLTAAADLIYYDNGASLDDPDGTLALLSSAKGVTQASYFDGEYGALWLPTDLLSRELSALEREASRTFNDPFPYGGVYRLNRRAVSYAVLSPVFLDDNSFRELCADNGLDAADYFDPAAPAAVLYNRITGRNDHDIWVSVPFFDESKLPFTVYCDGLSALDGYVLFDAGWDEGDYNVYYYYPEAGYRALCCGSVAPVDEMDESLIVARPASEAEATFELSVLGTVREAPFALERQYAYLIYPYSMRYAVFPEGSETEHTSSHNNSSSLWYAFMAENHSAAYGELYQILENAGLDGERLADRATNNRYQIVAVVVSVFAYGFIILISLIAVANVFNTISTNVSLRRREFAMLKSIGLSEKGFRKMMRWECLIYGLRSLIYGLPASALATLCVYHSVSNAVYVSFYIPWQSVAVAVVSVFAVVFVSMLYASHKLRRDDLVDVLKSENF